MTREPGVRWRVVGLFAVLALGGAWLVSLPLHLDGGLQNPHFFLIGAAVMATPAVAALVTVVGVLRPANPWEVLGLVGAVSWRRTAGRALAAAGGGVLLSVAAVLVAAAAGLVDLRVNPGALSSVLAIPVTTLVIGITAVGEEIGWRGFLAHALRPLGVARANLVNGALWGVWHAPLLLLGYNYGTTNPVSIPLMVVSTVLIGTLLAWVRERTGTIWAGALAHGALNASTSLLLAAFLPPAQQGADPTVLAWPGWTALAAAIALVHLRRSARGGLAPTDRSRALHDTRTQDTSTG